MERPPSPPTDSLPPPPPAAAGGLLATAASQPPSSASSEAASTASQSMVQRPPDRPGMSVREQLERKAPGGMGHHGLTDSDLRMQAEDALLFGGGGVGGGDGHWNATAIVDNRHQFLADQAFKALEKLSVEAASSKKLGEDVLREIKSAADDLPGDAADGDVTLLVHLLKVAYHHVGRDRLVDIVSDTIESEETKAAAAFNHRVVAEHLPTLGGASDLIGVE